MPDGAGPGETSAFSIHVRSPPYLVRVGAPHKRGQSRAREPKDPEKEGRGLHGLQEKHVPWAVVDLQRTFLAPMRWRSLLLSSQAPEDSLLRQLFGANLQHHDSVRSKYMDVVDEGRAL